MKNFSVTEVGMNKEGSLSFIKSSKEFLPLNNLHETCTLFIYLHDDKGNVNNIEIVDTLLGKSLAVYDKHVCHNALKGHSRKRFECLKADYKLGTLIQVPEFLISMWQEIKPIAIEKIA